jgi:hypothetical protein
LIRYLRYGLLLGVAAGCVNITAVVLFALLDGRESFVPQADSLPRAMLASYVGSLIAGLLVGLYRGLRCISGGRDPDR